MIAGTLAWWLSRLLGAPRPFFALLVPLVAMGSDPLGALNVSLTAEDLSQIESAVPKGAAAGERYAPAQMAHLDSER